MGTGGYAMPTETWPIAMCPGCQIQMKIMVVKPAKLADRMDEITYECPKCGTPRAVASRIIQTETSP